MYLSAIHRKKQNFCEDKRNPRCPRFAEHVCREWKKRFADKPGKQLMALKVTPPPVTSMSLPPLPCDAATAATP